MILLTVFRKDENKEKSLEMTHFKKQGSICHFKNVSHVSYQILF